MEHMKNAYEATTNLKRTVTLLKLTFGPAYNTTNEAYKI